MLRVIGLSCALVALALAGCAATREYVYEPAVRANAQASGFPAAYYEIPAGQPTGDVRIASFGLTTVQPNERAAPARLLRVRMIVTNAGDDAVWSVDVRQTQVAMAGQPPSAPVLANTDTGALPVVQVGRREQRTLDLYFQLPAAIESEDQLPAFDVLWQVTTGAGTVAQRTPFERSRIYQDSYDAGYPSPYAYGFGLGFGPAWWYDPFYPHYRLHGPPIVIVPGHGHRFDHRHGHVRVRPAPHRHLPPPRRVPGPGPGHRGGRGGRR